MVNVLVIFDVEILPFGRINRMDVGISVTRMDSDVYIEVMGVKYPAVFHGKPAFDPKNLRIQGIYE